MAATCQERGITHVKDVFTAQAKKQAEDEKEVASNFFFGFNTGTKPNAEKSPAPGSGVGGGKNGARPGGFLMRNGKSKDVDIMEIPVPPPRKQRADSSNGNNSKSSGGPTPQLLSTPAKPVNSKDTYLAPRSVTKSAQRNSSTSSGNSNNSEKERSRSKDAVTVAMIHRPPAVTLPSPTIIPTSPTKRTAPLPPRGGPASPPWRSSLPRSPPPPSPEAQLPRSPPLPPPPPPPQFASSYSPTRVVAPAPPPPGTSRIFSPVATPPDVPLPPPPPPPMNTTSPPPFRATAAATTQIDTHPDRASKSRYSSESHTLHIDTSSPLTHSHRREGSGDYSTGSLFNGDDDRDIIVSSQDNQNNHSPVFRDMLVSMDTHDTLPGLNNNNNKQESSKNAALFKKQKRSDIVVDYNSKKPTSPAGFRTKAVVSSGLPDNESSILTNSEHGAASSGYFSELSTTDSEKSPPSPAVLKKKNQPNKGTIEGSSSSSSFEEEVFSINFDEDKFAETNRTKIYHEYDGEDFGKYLQEDDPYPPSTTTLTRRVQRKKQEQYGQPRTLPPPNRSSPHTPQGQKRGAGLKEKFTQAFTLTRSEKKSPRYQSAPHHQHQQPKTSIHEMSFMNSKMGMYASEEDMRDYMARDLETKSDLGGVRKSSVNEMPSWHKDTLSVSTLRRAKRELDQRQAFSSSTPNLTDHGYFVGGGSPQNSGSTSPPASPRYGESYSDFGADIKKEKKVNRFKFWKVFGKKKKGSPSGPVIENHQPECVDVRL